jgi:NADP-dependent 3-hydroxy acid dehydrogenase YdfG
MQAFGQPPVTNGGARVTNCRFTRIVANGRRLYSHFHCNAVPRIARHGLHVSGETAPASHYSVFVFPSRVRPFLLLVPMSLKSPSSVVVVTGAGSGVGRATVLHFAREGWQVALVGRRAEALAETVGLAPAASRKNLAALPCDVGQPAAVESMSRDIMGRFGRVDVLVNAAGTNIPKRSLGELSRADYTAVMDANINGVLYTVQAFLPTMRRQGAGTVVNVGSEAGKQASAKAGAAYVVSKFGLTGLTQTINAEERPNGIRACCIFPGDIDTPLLSRRPTPPPAEARARMMQPEDIAACVWFVATLPARATVEELLVRPSRPWTG